MDGLNAELEQGRQSQQQLKAHYIKRIEALHAQTEAYRLVGTFYCLATTLSMKQAIVHLAESNDIDSGHYLGDPFFGWGVCDHRLSYGLSPSFCQVYILYQC